MVFQIWLLMLEETVLVFEETQSLSHFQKMGVIVEVFVIYCNIRYYLFVHFYYSSASNWSRCSLEETKFDKIHIKNLQLSSLEGWNKKYVDVFQQWSCFMRNNIMEEQILNDFQYDRPHHKLQYLSEQKSMWGNLRKTPKSEAIQMLLAETFTANIRNWRMWKAAISIQGIFMVVQKYNIIFFLKFLFLPIGSCGYFLHSWTEFDDMKIKMAVVSFPIIIFSVPTSNPLNSSRKNIASQW